MISIFRALNRGLLWVGERIALVVTPIILSVFYVVVIGVAKGVALLVRADFLHRRAPGNPTFWFPKPADPRSKDRYLAQF